YNQPNILRIGAPLVIKILVIPFRLIVDLELLDQTFRVLVLVQKFERAGQINAGQIVLPLVLVILVEVIAQIKNVIGGDHTFAREHINRVGNSARIDDV